MKFKLLSLAVVVTAMLVACNGNNNTQQPQPVSNGQQQQVTPAATPENNADAAQPQPAANAQQALPEAINTFVQQSFPGAKITYTETDQEYGGLEYDVTLDNGTKIDFDRNNQWNQHTGYEETFVNLLLLPLSDSDFDAQTDSVCYHNLWQHHSQSVEELAEPAAILRTSYCEVVLIADIPHTEQDGRYQGNHHKENRTLRVDGVVNLSTTDLCSLTWHEEESLCCVEK